MGCEILARNAFDSATGAIACDGDDPTGTGGATDPVDTTEPAACDASLRLVATYVPQRDPSESFASIRDGSGRALLYAIGMAVGARQVSSIERERVELRQGGVACTLALFERGAAPGSAEGPPPSAPPRAPLAGVRTVGDRVEVSASTISRAIADPMSFAGTMRALPAAGGLRLAGIRSDHALAAFGIRSGDLVRTLDGAPLDGPDAWLGAMGAIARPGAHMLEIERGGRRVEIGVDVVP
jgi:general secretion pathway protein C